MNIRRTISDAIENISHLKWSAVEDHLHNFWQIKWPTAGATGSGLITATNAPNSGFLENLWSHGILGMFVDWSRQDTFTVIGFFLTLISLKLAYESIKVNKERIAWEKEKHGRNRND